MSEEQEHLQQLYPFLHGRQRDAESVEAALLTSVRQKAAHSAEVKAQFFASQAGVLVEAARAIAGVFQRGGRLLCMGNGGSSCDAAHLTVEFMHPVTAGRPALPAIDLSANNATLTAVANDLGAEHIFLRQLVALGRVEDALVGFSTSGNSANLLAAYARAREMGMVTVGLAGGDGGDMLRSPYVDHCLVVDCDSVHRIQETHLAIYHILWDLVHTLLADTRGGLEASR